MSGLSMEQQFGALAAALHRALRPGERYTATLDAEDTDFVRLNCGKVRQPGHVSQRYLTVRLIDGARHASHLLSLRGDPAADGEAAANALAGLRTVLPGLADDPHLLLPTAIESSRSERGAALPPSAAVVDEILDAAHGEDLVGIYAAGPVYRGFANSEGQRNWHATTTFNLSWSLYHRADKAVKSTYAGLAWDSDEFVRKMVAARERLELIARAPKRLEPGKYRAFLTPDAVDEVAGLLCWGAFSGRALATKQSPLVKMQSGEALDARIAFHEDTAGGVAPSFQDEGFARPPRIPLVREGKLVGSLVSPRTAREFGLAANGANGAEMPEALALDGGDLPAADALAALDTGLLVGNLHYLNYSDRPACRITGMTRFATFWVEHGMIVAPVDVLRFDDTLYRMFGSNLEALTRETELLLSGESYRSRQLTSSRLPGALVRELSFTL